MKAIFSWGYEAPVREDYTKDKAEISNKIRKMRREYISECHDNYRKPQNSEDNQLLFNYFDQEEIELFKHKVFSLAAENDRENKNRSSYQENFCLAELKKMLMEIEDWTAAGKAVLKDRPNQLRMPLDDMRKKIEATLVKIGFKREVANDCSTSFYRAEEHSKSPNKTPGQPEEQEKHLNIDLGNNL